MKELSKIALGCDSRTFHDGGDITPLMDICLREGVNVFDTARGYGHSERVLGEYIRAHGNREDYYVISKGCLPLPFSRLNVRALKKDLETSLKTLDIGYIDMYLLHRDDHRADLEGILKVLNEYRLAGKIRGYGGSNWKKERVEKANEIAKANGYEPFTGVSDNFSLVPWKKDPWGGGDGCVCVSGDEAMLSYLKEQGIPNFAYSPLGRGFLTGRVKSMDPSSFHVLVASAKRAYLSEANLARLARIEEIARRLNLSVSDLAIAYICNHPTKTIPVIGTTSPVRLEQNIGASKIVLDEETMKELMAIAK
ncbi:MAG: aldo/keto reductase [Bacilli bacterium]|nr:aldo/keto reductase [Bacilli bacterium]